jgi:hypothetical protein
MFELSRLIVRESEFRPSPDKSEARREVLLAAVCKQNRGTGVAFFWLLFLAKQEK